MAIAAPATIVFVLFCAIARIPHSTSMPTVSTETVRHIYSKQTDRVLSFSADGTVTADGQYQHPQSQIKVHYLADNQVRLQHMVDSKDCFLVFENGQFRGSAPMGGNELFQLERVDGYEVLKLVNYRLLEEESSSGSGAGETNGTNVNATSTTEKPANSTDEPTDTTEEPASTTEEPASTTEEPTTTTEEPTGATEGATEATDCYLGVSVDDSTLICYPSNDTDATKFLIIP